MLTIKDSTTKLIQSNEGCRLKAYQDIAGVWTIGWGIIEYENGNHVKEGDTITQAYADLLLEKQIALKVSQINPYVTAQLNQNQMDAVIDFVYNVGVGGFLGSTLRKRININPKDPLIKNAFEMWDKIHKDGQLEFSQDLFNRRQKEVKIYFS